MTKIRWGFILLMLWLLTLLAAYYRTHGILTGSFINAAGGAVLDIFTVTLIAVVAGGIGTHITSRFDLAPLSSLERAALQGALGLGVIGWLLLALGMVGAFRTVVLWIPVAAAGAIVYRDILRWWSDLRDGIAGLAPRDGWTYFLAGFVLFGLLAALIAALAPPYAWDAMSYHLVGSARYLAEGRIAPHADNHFLGFPQGAEILYGLVMSLFGRDTAAAPLHGWFGVLGLLTIAGLLRRWLDQTAAWLALALLMSAYSLWLLFGWPYVDLAVMAYGALAFTLAICWRETRQRHWLILMGLCAGLALGVKYTAGGLLLALLIYLVLTEPRRIVRNGLILGITAALAFLPWAIKGLALYGNPVYPFAFGGLNWDVERALIFSGAGGLWRSGGAWQLPILPITATIFGIEKGPTYSFTAGPWLLTAPLLLIPAWRWLDDRAKTLARDCLRLGIPLLIFWIVMAAFSNIGAQTRLMLMALPVFAIAGAIALHSVPRWEFAGVQVILRGLLAFTLLITGIDIAQETNRSQNVDYLLGATSRENFLLANLGTYYNAMQHLGTLPPDSQVRFLWEPKTFYCPPTITCTPDILFDNWGRALKDGQSPEDMLDSWRDTSVDYVLVFDTGYQFITSAEANSYYLPEDLRFEEIAGRELEAVWTDGISYTLYQWK